MSKKYDVIQKSKNYICNIGKYEVLKSKLSAIPFR